MLQEQIEEDFKTALKAHDTLRLDTLRLVKAAIQNAQIQQGKPLDEAGLVGLVRSQLKQRAESAEAFIKAGRAELAQKERAQAELLEKYLPSQPSDEALTKAVADAIQSIGAQSIQDMGKVMAALRQTLDPSVDMGKVSQLVKAALTEQK